MCIHQALVHERDATIAKLRAEVGGLREELAAKNEQAKMLRMEASAAESAFRLRQDKVLHDVVQARSERDVALRDLQYECGM